MAERGALIDQVVSGPAWAKFPSLRDGIERWSTMAGDKGTGTVVSAFIVSGEYLAVRVSREGRDGSEADWIEWQAPIGFREAHALAVHQFAAHEMEAATSMLARRATLGAFPFVLARSSIPDREVNGSMAKKPTEAAPTPAPSKGKPGPKPKAEAKAPDPPAAKATGSKPGPKPKAPAKSK